MVQFYSVPHNLAPGHKLSMPEASLFRYIFADSWEKIPDQQWCHCGWLTDLEHRNLVDLPSLWLWFSFHILIRVNNRPALPFHLCPMRLPSRQVTHDFPSLACITGGFSILPDAPFTSQDAGFTRALPTCPTNSLVQDVSTTE